MVFVHVLEFAIEKVNAFAQFVDLKFEFGIFEFFFFEIRAQLVAFHLKKADHIIFDFSFGDFHFFSGLFLGIFVYFGDFFFGEILGHGDFFLQFNVLLFGLPLFLRGIGDRCEWLFGGNLLSAGSLVGGLTNEEVGGFAHGFEEFVVVAR